MAQVLTNTQLTLQALRVCIFHDIFLGWTTQEVSVPVEAKDLKNS